MFLGKISLVFTCNLVKNKADGAKQSWKVKLSSY